MFFPILYKFIKSFAVLYRLLYSFRAGIQR